MFCSKRLLRFSAWLTAWTVFINFHVPVPVYAQTPNIGYSAARNLMADVTAIRIPSQIGEVQEFYRGSQDKLIVLIQDAHSIPDAQNSIRALLSFFQGQYGIDLTLIEGSADTYDPQIFRSYPDEKQLKQTFKQYLTQAELTGTTAAAIFNEDEGIYEGIEDWHLYEKGVEFYLDALSIEPEASAQLKEFVETLSEVKNRTYSDDLLYVDRMVGDFREDHIDLLKLLQVLSRYHAPPSGSKLEALVKSLDKTDAGTAIDLTVEVKSIARRIEAAFKSMAVSAGSLADFERFNLEKQRYGISEISAEQYGLFLYKLIRKYRLPIRVSNKLGEKVGQQKRIQDIRGTQLFRDLEAYIRNTKKTLFRNAEETRLDQESTRLDILERLIRLELTQEDWQALKQFWTEYRQDTVAADGVITGFEIKGLLDKLRPHVTFYEVAHERDLIFMKKALENMKKHRRDQAILVAGGFHTEGLTQQFEQEGVSYLLIRPEIKSMPDEYLYREHMQGKVSWSDYFEVRNGKVNLYEAFVRGTRDFLLKQSTTERGRILKNWRDQIIRDLAAKGEIERAGEYVRFIDELNQNKDTALSELQRQWMDAIDAFIDGVEDLNSSGRLTANNVLGLMGYSTTAEPVLLGLARNELRVGLLPGFAVRSEVRSEDSSETQAQEQAAEISNFNSVLAALETADVESQNMSDLLDAAMTLSGAGQSVADVAGGPFNQLIGQAFNTQVSFANRLSMIQTLINLAAFHIDALTTKQQNETYWALEDFFNQHPSDIDNLRQTNPAHSYFLNSSRLDTAYDNINQAKQAAQMVESIPVQAPAAPSAEAMAALKTFDQLESEIDGLESRIEDIGLSNIPRFGLNGLPYGAQIQPDKDIWYFLFDSNNSKYWTDAKLQRIEAMDDLRERYPYFTNPKDLIQAGLEDGTLSAADVIDIDEFFERVQGSVLRNQQYGNFYDINNDRPPSMRLLMNVGNHVYREGIGDKQNTIDLPNSDQSENYRALYQENIITMNEIGSENILSFDMDGEYDALLFRAISEHPDNAYQQTRAVHYYVSRRLYQMALEKIIEAGNRSEQRGQRQEQEHLGELPDHLRRIEIDPENVETFYVFAQAALKEVQEAIELIEDRTDKDAVKNNFLTTYTDALRQKQHPIAVHKAFSDLLQQIRGSLRSTAPSIRTVRGEIGHIGRTMSRHAQKFPRDEGRRSEQRSFEIENAERLSLFAQSQYMQTISSVLTSYYQSGLPPGQQYLDDFAKAVDFMHAMGRGPLIQYLQDNPNSIQPILDILELDVKVSGSRKSLAALVTLAKSERPALQSRSYEGLLRIKDTFTDLLANPLNKNNNQPLYNSDKKIEMIAANLQVDQVFQALEQTASELAQDLSKPHDFILYISALRLLSMRTKEARNAFDRKLSATFRVMSVQGAANPYENFLKNGGLDLVGFAGANELVKAAEFLHAKRPSGSGGIINQAIRSKALNDYRLRSFLTHSLVELYRPHNIYDTQQFQDFYLKAPGLIEFTLRDSMNHNERMAHAGVFREFMNVQQVTELIKNEQFSLLANLPDEVVFLVIDMLEPPFYNDGYSNFHKRFTKKILMSEDFSDAVRLYAFGRYAQKEVVLTQEPLETAVNIAVHKLKSKSLKSGQEIVEGFSGAYDLKINNLAVLLWARQANIDVLDSDRAVKDYIDATMDSRLLYDLDNANSAMEFGVPLLKRISGESFMMITAHEYMHRILGNQFKYYSGGADQGGMHEFLADLLAFKLAADMGWDVNDYVQKLNFESTQNRIINRGYVSDEVHDTGRAQFMELYDALGNETLSTKRLMDAALDVMTKHPQKERIRSDFGLFIEMTFRRYLDYSKFTMNVRSVSPYATDDENSVMIVSAQTLKQIKLEVEAGIQRPPQKKTRQQLIEAGGALVAGKSLEVLANNSGYLQTLREEASVRSLKEMLNKDLTISKRPYNELSGEKVSAGYVLEIKISYFGADYFLPTQKQLLSAEELGWTGQHFDDSELLDQVKENAIEIIANELTKGTAEQSGEQRSEQRDASSAEIAEILEGELGRMTGDLVLNGIDAFAISGSEIRYKALVESNRLNIDMGSIIQPEHVANIRGLFLSELQALEQPGILGVYLSLQNRLDAGTASQYDKALYLVIQSLLPEYVRDDANNRFLKAENDDVGALESKLYVLAQGIVDDVFDYLKINEGLRVDDVEAQKDACKLCPHSTGIATNFLRQAVLNDFGGRARVNVMLADVGELNPDTGKIKANGAQHLWTEIEIDLENGRTRRFYFSLVDSQFDFGFEKGVFDETKGKVNVFSFETDEERDAILRERGIFLLNIKDNNDYYQTNFRSLISLYKNFADLLRRNVHGDEAIAFEDNESLDESARNQMAYFTFFNMMGAANNLVKLRRDKESQGGETDMAKLRRYEESQRAAIFALNNAANYFQRYGKDHQIQVDFSEAEFVIIRAAMAQVKVRKDDPDAVPIVSLKQVISILESFNRTSDRASIGMPLRMLQQLQKNKNAEQQIDELLAVLAEAELKVEAFVKNAEAITPLIEFIGGNRDRLNLVLYNLISGGSEATDYEEALLALVEGLKEGPLGRVVTQEVVQRLQGQQRSRVRQEIAQQRRVEDQGDRSEFRSAASLEQNDALAFAQLVASPDIRGQLNQLIDFGKQIQPQLAAQQSIEWAKQGELNQVRQRMKEAALTALLAQLDVSGNRAIITSQADLDAYRQNAQALMATLSVLGDRSYTLGLSLPDGLDVARSPLIEELLKIMRAGEGNVSEIVFEGQLPVGVQNDFTDLDAIVRSHPFNSSRGLITYNDQPAVPVLTLDAASSFNPMFIPFGANLEGVEDQFVQTYVEMLRSVAAIHTADLISRDKDRTLLLNPDQLKAELLSRLQRFGDSYENILTRQGDGWVVMGSVARAQLEMEIARITAASA